MDSKEVTLEKPAKTSSMFEWALAQMVRALGVLFYALGFGARLLAPVFSKPLAWRVLDACVGALMWAIALHLFFG